MHIDVQLSWLVRSTAGMGSAGVLEVAVAQRNDGCLCLLASSNNKKALSHPPRAWVTYLM